MRVVRFLILFMILFSGAKSIAQEQDVDFHLNSKLLAGKNILKVKRDFYDPYLWVLAANNEVFRVNSLDMQVEDFTAAFAGYNAPFVDIAGREKGIVYVATALEIIVYNNGALSTIGAADGLRGTIIPSA